MTNLDPWYEARTTMRRALERDLMGTSEDDRLTEPPLDRFVVGILHPVSAQLVEDAAAVPDVETGTQVDAEYDPGINLARMRRPSSMGLTFAVNAHETSTVLLRVQADRYLPQIDGEPAEPEDRLDVPDPESGNEHVVERVASRRPKNWNLVEGEPFEVSVAVDAPGPSTFEAAEGLQLRVIVRAPLDGVVSITAVLVNGFPEPARGGSDEWCWFRPRIEAMLVEGAFAQRRSTERTALGEEEASSDLLYRDAVSIAVGHGVAVDWPAEDAVRHLSTTYLPAHEVPVARASREELDGFLGMASLGSNDDRTPLHRLVDAYEGWIDRQEAQVGSLPEYSREVGRAHIERAREAARRMRAGIASLDADPNAARAFRVMNAAMQEQRARQVMIRSGAQAPSTAEQHWRPFQLAFILLNLPGVVDPQHEERDVADLLWFPTGGGKTEAYLGLVAFTLALRRLRNTAGEGGGVGVLMRYTLRLLTLQQFERAASLICALEHWRTKELPSAAPISIGLWVGAGATPNKLEDARRALKKLESGRPVGDDGNPRQLLRCPWCGTKLPVSAYQVDPAADRLLVRCPGDSCEFASGLPVHVIDSDVYRAQPSLVIGTVDKFAMLAWRDQAGRLFGTDGSAAPPDLIIQDELHLISGPLGTLVGLYETAIDAASTGSARPKLVASTATIRRAKDQVRAVFDRDSRQFPPPGLDPGDSFFAVSAPRDELPTRQYVGVIAPGTSHSTLLVRSYAALLQAGKDLDASDVVRDAYWTLLGYFNSLRVLGAAYMQTIDDVPLRIPVVARRTNADARTIEEPHELTSRTPSTEVPDRLDELGAPYGDERCPDVVLATNMISVGVDVDRLGLMVMMGQPQTTSEYIQATSRVGRQRPGLVVTLYNAARTRDLSHYESFLPYHRALYRQVEATGATPFAPRAVDRGLHGVLVALVRLLVPGASDERAVTKLDSAGVTKVRGIVERRVERVSPREKDRVLDAFDALVDEWEDATDRLSKYTSWHAPSADALLVPAGGGPFNAPEDHLDQFPVSEPAWPTLTSLRNVDAESTLFIARRKLTRGN